MLNKAKILKEMIQIYMLHQCRSIVIGLEMITTMIHKIINSIISAYTFFENDHRNVLAEILDSIFYESTSLLFSNQLKYLTFHHLSLNYMFDLVYVFVPFLFNDS